MAQEYGGTVTVDIIGNTIRHVDVHGIRITSGNSYAGNPGKVVTTITGNRISDPDGPVLEAINVHSGKVAADAVCLQATIGGTFNPGVWPSSTAGAMNRIEGNWDPTPGGIGGEIFVWETGTSTLAVPGANCRARA